MSSRLVCFRFAFATFIVLATVVFFGLRIHSQDLTQPAGKVDAAVNEKEMTEVMEELFPYVMGVQSAASGRDANLITAASYAFAAPAGIALEDMSSGTTQLLGASLDDNASAVTPIGFDFWFDGVRYSEFSVNANGLARLGATAVTTAFNNSTSGLNTVTNAPKIATYFEDLCIGDTGRVHQKVVGTAPNRKLVVEWQNMKIPREGTCTAATGVGVFQMWLFESAGSTSPGRIQFVYGGGIGPSDDTDLGASIGLQSGVATNFASVTVSDDSVSYTTANNTNLPGIASGKSYVFTPNVPTAPTGLSFSAVTALSQQLNWSDNASNEVGYAIYRSTDGTNFTFVAQTAADAVSYNDTGLLPSTNYSYRVYAVTEGALSGALSGSQATAAPGNVACNGSGGNWSDTASWTGGVLPTSSDNVTIASGCTVTVDTTMAAALNVTINSGGTLQSPATGTDSNLTIGGSLTNNGTLDFSTNGDTAGAILTFGAALPSVTFGGSGAVTDVRAVTIAKGSQAATVELNPSNFTVQGVNTDSAGFLTITSGTLKVSGTFALNNRLFTVAAYSIPAAGGLWMNNPNLVIAGQNGSPTVTGLLRITQGTLNIGTSTGNSMGFATGSEIIVEGGAVNAAGRFGVSAATSVIDFSMSGGTVTVQTAGNTSTTLAGFDLGTATGSSVTISGGTIVVQLANTAASGPRDYRHQSGSAATTGGIAGVTGGTLQLGNANSGAAKTFTMRGVVPNLVIDNTSAGHTGQWDTVATNWNNISRNITINPTTTLNLGNIIFLFSGTTFTNNGTLVHNGASSRTYFFGAGALAPQTFTGTGTVTAPLTSLDFDNGLGVTIGESVPGIVTNRVIMFSGNVTNSDKITIGNGGTTAATIQIGNTTTPLPAGVFDEQINYNPGSGGIVMSYLRTSASRVMGFEVPASRTINNINYDDNDPMHTLTVAGGNLTVLGNLTLTNGVIVTGANSITHNGTAARTNGYVNGTLNRSYTAVAAYTYHVGQNGYSPAVVNVTALGTNPSSLSVKPVDSTLSGLNSAASVSRHWTLAEAGDLTADLAFTYQDADVNGTETDYRIFKLAAGVLTNMCMGGPCVNDGTNTASVTGISDFSDWGIGENGAAAAGELAFSNATYSSDEAGPTATITVNRAAGSSGAITVDYATVAGGTATGGASCGGAVDYVNASGTLNFASGETSKTFDVTLCNDTDDESDETVNLALTNPTGGATLGTPNTAVLTITDNDAPSGGPVIVTATAGTPGPTNYPTLKDAVDAINAGTHQGAITVEIVTSTTETATSVLNGSGAGSASYTSIIVRPVSDGVSVSGPSAQGRGLIELNGADNVTIDGDNPNTAGTNRNLTIQNTATNTTTFTSVIRVALATTVVNSADNNTIRNLKILGSATGRNISTATTTTGSENTTFGILLGTGASTVDATNPPAAITSVSTGVAAGATATNFTVRNNEVQTAARAVSINGSATTVAPGLQINNNSIGNPTAAEADQVTAIGITAQGSTDAIISGNTVWVEGFVASSAAGHGINVGVNSANVTGATIERNKVNRVMNNNPNTWSAFGINLGGGSSHVVRNNFVSGVLNNQVTGTGGFGTTFGAYGIRVASGTGHDVYHNSVHLYGAMPGSVNTNLTVAFMIVGTGQTGVDVRNNIFSNQVSGGNPTGTRHAVVYLPSGATATMNLTINNNAYYGGTDAFSLLAKAGTVFGSLEFLVADFDPTATTPAANFRSYTSTLSAAGTNDNASFATTSAPPFTSNVDLHIPAGTATRLESGGAAVGVTDDIDLEARNATTPDIGADEFAGSPAPANDIGAVAFVEPANGSTVPTGSLTPQARFTNNGTATQNNVTVRFRIFDSMMTEIYNQTATIATIAPLQNVVVTFPSTTISSPGAYTMQATAELAGDQNPANDTISGSFNTVVPISGTISVGTGQTYTSLTNPGGLFEALNVAGISSNLIVNITSDLTAETGVVRLEQLTESGAGGYTVTFKPSGAARTISGLGTANNGLINLHGADRIIFDGSLSGGDDRSLTITNTQTGTSTVFWIKSASAANGANNNTVKNCIINGAATASAQTTAGILAGSGVTIGGAAEAPNNDNTVTNNHIYRVQNSIYNQGNTGFDQNWTVTNNEFGATAEADKNRFRGMLMGNANNFVISGNNVHGVTSFTGTTAAMSGIQLAFAVTNGSVTGNRISNINNTSTAGTGAFGLQLSASPTTNITIANNFIWDVQAVGSATVTSNGHGININGAASAGGYKIYHNSVNMNTNQASGTTAALNLTSAVVAAGAIDLRNNILANTQTAGATRRSVHSAAAATVFSMIDYNDYFSTGSVGFIGGTDRPTLADWQAGTTQDANSKAVDPLFISPTDLHLQPTSTLLGMGVAGTGITTDIDGQTRDAMPDIGADEIPAGANPGSLQFSNATYSGGEGAGPFTVTVTRTGGTAGTVSVQYATSNGTATGGGSCGAGIDYVTTSGTLTFLDGETSKTFNVTICNDTDDEPNETINYTLSNPTGGAVLGTPSTAVQTIIDDDAGPAGSFSINDVRIKEGNSGAVNAVFTITYNGPVVPVSVQYATANGTATAGVDYLAASGTVTFNSAAPEGLPAPQTQTVTVVINSDVVKEANETFFVNLSSPTGATIADSQGVGIIIDEDRAYVADFDLDKLSDFSVYRPSEGRWYVLRSSDATPEIVDFGVSTDIAVPGDYDGDGLADYALFRPSTGEWYRILSATATKVVSSWGAAGDKPVQGDYDGDGKTDLAIFRPSTGFWWVLRSSNGTSFAAPFGISTDRPVQGDYDGDAKTDLAVYRDGAWYISRSSDGAVQSANWGLAADKPVSGDFDGDGKFDLAIYRNGAWWTLNSLDGTSSVAALGLSTDIPVPADYDGDGTTDRAVFRPSNGDWYVLRSSNGTLTGVHWGISGDVPVPAAYLPQ